MPTETELAELERLRCKTYRKHLSMDKSVFVCKVLSWLCFAILLYGVFFNKTVLGFSIIFLFIFLSIAGCIDTYKGVALLKYKNEIKQKVYNLIFSGELDFEYVTMSDEKVSKLFDKLYSLNLFGAFTKLVCDDCFVCKIEDISFKIYDIGVYNIAVGYKAKVTKKIFEGMLIVAPSFKNFSGVTVIRADKKLKLTGDIGTMLERVNFEDNVFEKEFDVYSTNQIEARYLLTTAFMERLVRAVDKEKKQIIGSFEDGKVFIGVQDSKDLFELDLSKPLTDKETFKPLFEEIKQAVELVKSLKLEQKTGL